MDEVSQIREKIDLISLISEYIPLKKLGRNFKSNCPFHNEKTPSFVVSPERQIWHCFGCGKGGDCFTFLMEYENLEFPEALRILAKRSGIELKARDFQTGVSSKKEKIYKLNRLALEFYHFLLTKHNVGKKALNYLKTERKINPGMIELFKIGISPSFGGSLSNYLIEKKGYKKEELVEAGLSILRPNKTVDFFANRLIFPLFDHRDNVIGFSGRVLDGSATSKYINTRETLVYHKGNTFFGLNLAKEEIKKEESAIIVEGEFDVISLFQEGIKNVIAVKGTALTEEQAQLISRFAKRVSVSFDQDNAGQEALKRSLSVLEKKGLATSVIVSANGKDPDESIKKDPISFKKSLKNPLGVYDYLLEKILSANDKNKVEGKKKIAEEFLPFVSQIENEIIKEHYLRKLSQVLDTSYESVALEVEKLNKETKSAKILETKEKKQREEILEEYFLSMVFQSQNPGEIFGTVKSILKNYVFYVPAYGKIAEHFADLLKLQKGEFNSKKFVEMLPAELVPAYDTCYLFPLPKFADEEAFKTEILKVTEELRTIYLKKRVKELGEKIKAQEESENREGLETAKTEFSSLVKLLKKE